MINSVTAYNIPQAYVELIYMMGLWGREEESRNGPVLTSPDPVYLKVYNPMQRVLTDPIRDANPFFHVMEFVWMLAGENDVTWITQFNKRFAEYADPGTSIIHASYGHRWIKHFGCNQIQVVASMLASDRNTRRAVMGMWDPRVDLEPHNDLPCNTQVMFRWHKELEQLDMTVTNRSNDLIWGMVGANAVHMTYMFELVCTLSGLKMGSYNVFTNNLHVYKNLPKYREIMATLASPDTYKINYDEPYPLLSRGESYDDLIEDALLIMGDGRPGHLRCNWMKAVAWPMMKAYKERLEGGTGGSFLGQITASDWRRACLEWCLRKDQAKGSVSKS